MSQNIDNGSSDVLRFRPVIQFVEPAQEPFAITPVTEPAADQPGDILAKRRELKNYADALGLLAAALQARIDIKAAGMEITLDPNVDTAVIQAMRRQFPESVNTTTITPSTNTDNPGTQTGYVITYAQYKAVRDNIRNYACDTAANLTSITSPDAVAAARQDLLAGKVNIGGLDTSAASNGGLRPELYDKAQLIKPLEMDKFQNELIKILVNYIWKHFIYPLLSQLPIIGGSIPEELVHVNHPLPASIPTLK